MRKFQLALILAASAALQLAPVSQPASAADLPGLKDDVPYEFMPLWQGFYFGGHAGGIWGNTGVNDNFTYIGDPTLNPSLSGTNFIGGGQAGYNFQSGHFVFGLEGDIGYLGIFASKSGSSDPISCTGTYTAAPYTVQYTGDSAKMCDVDAKYSSSSNLYGDLTGRLGYLADRTLFYAKGGVAFLDADFKANYAGQSCMTLNTCGSGGPSLFNFGHSETLTGWTAGAGVEYALNPRWSLKAEYQHFDFGSMSYSYSGSYVIPTVPDSWHAGGHYTSTLYGKTDVSVTADAVTLGVNYHLTNEAGLQ